MKFKDGARGYLHVEVDEQHPLKVADALLASKKSWKVYDTSWGEEPEVRISPVEGAGLVPSSDIPGLPDTIKMEGALQPAC